MNKFYKYALLVAVILLVLSLVACSSPTSLAKEQFLRDYPKMSSSDISNVDTSYNSEGTICYVTILVSGEGGAKGGGWDFTYTYEKLSGKWTLIRN